MSKTGPNADEDLDFAELADPPSSAATLAHFPKHNRISEEAVRGRTRSRARVCARMLEQRCTCCRPKSPHKSGAATAAFFCKHVGGLWRRTTR